MKNLLCVAIITVLFTLFSNSINAQDSELDPTLAPLFENFTGTVHTIAKQSDGKILVGGYFLRANNKNRYGLARFNSDGSLDESFNSIIGVYPTGVRAIAVQPDGKILVGGFFVVTSSRYNIVRLNPNGTLDSTFNATTSSVVYAIAVQSDGKIIIGGSFTQVNNTSRFGTARLNTNGTIDNTFTLSIRITAALAIQPNGDILVGGTFSGTSPNIFSRIIRVSPTGQMDTNFNANVSINNTVRAIKLQADGKILAGGSFSSVNGNFRNNLARLNSNGTIDSAFSPSITGFSTTIIEAIDIDTNGKILIGGEFEGVNGAARVNVAKLNLNGTTDTTFSNQTGASLRVRSVLPNGDGNTLIGGDFQSVDGMSKYRIAKLNSNGSVDTTFNAAAYSNGVVNDVEIQSDGKILVGGDYSYLNGTIYTGVTRFNTDGTIDSTFADFNQAAVVGFPVNDMEIQPDGKIIVVGLILFNNNQNNYGVVRLNTNGTVDNSFAPVTINSNIPTVAKVLPNGQILVGGEFTDLSGTTRVGLARLNSNGSLDNGFNPTISNSGQVSIRDIVVRADGKIVIAGAFSSINGTTRNNLARLNSDGSLDTNFTADTTGSVLSLKELPNQSLLVGGFFTSINGTTTNRVAKLLPDGQVDSSFNVDSNIVTPYNDIETYDDGRIILAGAGVQSNVYVLNPNGSVNSFVPDHLRFDNHIFDIAVSSDGRVIFGGRFAQVGSADRFGLARFNSLEFSTNKPVFDFDGDGKTDISIFRPDAGQWWYLRSSDFSNAAFAFGTNTDKLVPADYTGDGKTDIAFWRESTGEWFILRSEDSSFFGFPFGTAGDIPAPGDFDGDGIADAAVYRPSETVWYIQRSSDGQTAVQQFGVAEDIPTVADFDGDGKDDIAIYRPSVSQWWQLRSTAGTIGYQFGTIGDKTIQGDYTGDGKADVGVFRPSTGQWLILRSEDSSFFGFPFGVSTDIPSPGDYDGDGTFDAAVFRPSTNTWFYNGSTSGNAQLNFGISGDVPIPNVYSAE